MLGIKKILVVIDSRKAQQPALRQAVELARTCDATLHILAPFDNPSADSLTQLEQTVAPFMEEATPFHLHEHWNEHLTDTILDVQQAEQCQLIVKDARPFKPLKNTFKTPNDWSLLRQSPVPVLLIKTDSSWHQAPILAAINADPDDVHHAAMNHAILEYACGLASAYASEAHVATAYPTTHLAARSYEDSITDEAAYRQNGMTYTQHYGIDPHNLFVQPGPADTVIARLTRESGAHLLVLGTHARTGLSAFAIGNTAEQLINQIDTDILVLEPGQLTDSTND